MTHLSYAAAKKKKTDSAAEHYGAGCILVSWRMKNALSRMFHFALAANICSVVVV